ncbi:Endonuclease/exonuclease/phosphatase family protein [Flavobacterium sp. 9AF]|uniref:lamin tail domain-containing protein n=1 Tax=Flavobacterium sp. 9AF TaxID=2653142 RepID=UPI0012EF3754|nr:lamin tail domain-containing protein [Flavobacterium sp. 9AF]VXB05548.1 Endonuclease/exonuclease/phosphatase family protein [Flavobacterium sp. 9AF]
MKLYFKIALVVCLSLLLTNCTTDDIEPTLISFEVSNTNLNENGGNITITAKLNANTNNQISIPILISGSASLSNDFTISKNEIIINKGNSSGEITITGIDDIQIEGIETIILKTTANDSYILLNEYSLEIQLLDDDSDSDNDGVPDSLDECPTVFGEIENNGCPYLGFLINEILYDPEATLLGDANGDGTRDANDDEFIEFYNSGPALDISGYKIFDSTGLTNNTPRHVFPSGTIVPANGVIVVFGGGNPTGTFGGAIVQTASGGQINITNAGDVITLQDGSGNTITTLDIEPLSDNPDESYTRNPDLTGNFTQHSSIPESLGTLFSPGTKIDGSLF